MAGSRTSVPNGVDENCWHDRFSVISAVVVCGSSKPAPLEIGEPGLPRIPESVRVLGCHGVADASFRLLLAAIPSNGSRGKHMAS